MARVCAPSSARRSCAVRCFARSDRRALFQQHWPVPGFHSHQAHAGFGIAGLDRALIGAAPAPAAATKRAFNSRIAEWPARCAAAAGRRRPPPSGPAATRSTSFETDDLVLRLQHRDAALHRFQFHRRRLQVTRPRSGGRSVSVDRDHLVGSSARRRSGLAPQLGVPAKTILMRRNWGLEIRFVEAASPDRSSESRKPFNSRRLVIPNPESRRPSTLNLLPALRHLAQAARGSRRTTCRRGGGPSVLDADREQAVDAQFLRLAFAVECTSIWSAQVTSA